ncbi:metal ABC transporter permease [bacterium]|nr:metal ABC transporter permease [bacterium]
MNDFYVILTASLVAINCALMGSFLVMRKMVMIGDAISHAVLPGIFIAYMVSGVTTNLVVLAGAALSGILATVLIEWFTKKVRLQNDASIGISYTLLFALGVILISRYGQKVDLDQECVLYGDIELTVLNIREIFSGFYLPSQSVVLMAVLAILLLAVILGYKGLLLTTFDPAFAASAGVSIGVWHYVLMSGVSLTTVVSFDSVGAILVISFLAGPPAIAYLLTERLKTLLFLASGIGVICSILGYYLAKAWDASVAGSISIVIGVSFVLVFFAVQLAKRKQSVISLE